MDFMPLDVDYQIQRKKRMLEVSVQDAFLKYVLFYLFRDVHSTVRTQMAAIISFM